jgi:hypothetical protein
MLDERPPKSVTNGTTEITASVGATRDFNKFSGRYRASQPL